MTESVLCHHDVSYDRERRAPGNRWVEVMVDNDARQRANRALYHRATDMRQQSYLMLLLEAGAIAKAYQYRSVFPSG